MLSKTTILFFITFALLSPSSVLSQTDEIKDYTIIEGDTLWDISGNELDDPFLWPKIWKENPEIKNPDRIYPDQQIRIPLFIGQPERKEEPAPVAVVKEPPKEPEIAEPEEPSYLIDKKLLIASGYLTDQVSSVGEITGSPIGRSLFGDQDLVYVRTDAPVDIGDKFYIKRAVKMIKHPVTNKEIGYLVEIVGIAEIKKFQFGDTIAKITHAFGPIITNNLLDKYYEIDPPLAAETYRKPDIEGYVVSTTLLRRLNSAYDIVYIDKGSEDGVEVGDLLRTVTAGEHKVPNGTIQIISARDTTSTAIVRDSTDPVTRGDLITQME